MWYTKEELEEKRLNVRGPDGANHEKTLDKLKKVWYNKGTTKEKEIENMNTNLKNEYINARIELARAKDAVKQAKTALTEMLVDQLPAKGEGLTAMQIAKANDMDSYMVANLLCSNGNARGTKYIVNRYARLNDDGTIDMEHIVSRKYIVATYRK